MHETPREHPENTTDPADSPSESHPSSPAQPRPTARAPISEAALPAAEPAAEPAPADGDDGHGGEESDETAPLPAEFYRCADERTRKAGIDAARRELARHQVVVMPTDTVYGIAANAFSVQGVRRLLEAKGRDRTMPPPVLIAHTGVLDGLADEISDEARALAAAFWPGGLTLICRAQPSLQWDLGETHGTVGLRVPDDEIARVVLSETGPLAVSSANRTGMPAATTAEQARGMLGDSVRVYLEAGPRAEGRDPDPSAPAPAPVSSTIVDCTGATPVVVRDGQISLTRLREVVPSVLALDGTSAPAAPEASDGSGPDVPGSEAAAPGADADGAPGAGAPDGEASEGEAVDTEAVDTEAPDTEVSDGGTSDGEAPGGDAAGHEPTGQRASGSTAAPAPAPQDPEADIVEEARAERQRAEPAAMDFSAAAPASGSTAAAVVAAGGRSAAARGASVPDQDRSRPTSSAPVGGTRPLGLAEASALVAFGTRGEPVEDDADGTGGAARDAGVDQQR